jgi:uncharacterized protein YabN with tetrapyrrole methylase and pyrophosphatase domain
VGLEPSSSPVLPPPGAAVSHQEVGDLLFAVVDLARHAGIDPEAALRGVSSAFRRRFEALERLADERGVNLGSVTPDDVAVLWDEAAAL